MTYPPSVTLHLPTVEDAQAALDAHLATRPDHLKALHPLAPRALREAFTEWNTLKDHLVHMLDLAKTAAGAGWRDAEGNRVNPAPWKPEPGAPAPKSRDLLIVYRQPVAKPTKPEKKANGRPRTSESKEAIRCRARRERAKAKKEAL